MGSDAVYDSLDAHIGPAGDIARASVPMGLLLAWCANLHLLSETVVAEHERLILRLRFQEASGSDLLIACGGVLSRDMFNLDGQRFLDSYYPGYMDVFRSVFGEDCYAVRDTWGNYEKIAATLTRAYMTKPARGPGLLGQVAGWFRRGKG